MAEKHQRGAGERTSVEPRASSPSLVDALETTVTLFDPTTGRTMDAKPTASCVSAGPKYRAHDRDGEIGAEVVDPSDVVTLAETMNGSIVYVADEPNGRIPGVWRLRKVVGGRPSRVAQA